MELVSSNSWLLLIQLAALLNTCLIATADRMHPDSAQVTEGTNKRQIIDITLPQRTNAASHRSNHFLTFSRTSQESELHYNLSAFGRVFEFELRPEKSFIAPSFSVEHCSGNLSQSIPSGVDLSHCFYRGSVRNDPVSSAVFDLCNGMRGAFKTRGKVYLIEPLVENNPGVNSSSGYGKQHVITDHLAALTERNTNSTFEIDEELSTSKSNDIEAPRSLPSLETTEHHRTKREAIFHGAQSYPRYVEVMVTADKTMLDHHGSEFELKRYIQTVMGVVHNIFLDPKIGNSIEVVLTGIKILKDFKDLKVTTDARQSLRAFCAWQHKQNVKSDSDAGHYDTAILMTKTNICRIKGHCETLGLAELGTMCNSARSCSIVEDNGLGVAFTVVHELGHVFNIGHDAHTKRCLGEKNGLHVMAPAVNLQATPWSWSACSRKEITEFLERGDDHCLMDKPQYQFKKSEKLPGELYSPTKQCKLSYGKDSSLCRFKKRPCRILWCSVKMRKGVEGCQTQITPWADGSPCGQGKWCIRGKCVRKQVVAKVDGAWSPWSEFGPCSRTCGGGVSYSSRTCTNPKPSNGGKFCLGAIKRFKSCQTQDCPKGSADFRAVQCAVYNNRRGPKGSKWVPSHHYNRCELFCERVGGGGFIKAKVIDGTKCRKDSFDICVNGICRLAGCDNVLNSRTKLDACGVCGGRNDTCKRIHKSWYKKVEWGYNKVATLHPGFSSIIIEQTTPGSEAERALEAKRYKRYRVGDDNYLALFNERNGNILNGGYYIKPESTNILRVAGVKIIYSGSRSYPEYIRIEGTLKQKIHVQVLSVERVEAPKVTYSYLIPVEKPDTFVWDVNEPYTRCSRECQGVRRKTLVCKRERDGQTMSSEHCKQNEKPGLEDESCNTHCLFKWMKASKGACQPGCGPGTQKIYYRCVKHFIKSVANLVQPGKACKLVTRPPSEQPCEGTCDNVIWVYSKWSECSKSCDSGVQRRRVMCVEKNSRKELPESMCSRIGKRHTERACNTLRCPTWRTRSWSRCSAECGEGYERRNVECVWKGNQITDDKACDMKTKPKDRQSCRIKACPHWEYEQWSDCSTTCGPGHQIRLVRCTNDDREALREEDCVAEQKPMSRRACAAKVDCDKTVFLVNKVVNHGPVKWVTRNWGKCSVQCGEGRQERNVSCVNSQEIIISNELCKNFTKPVTVRQCVKHCGKWKHSSWLPCSSECGEGIQRRNITCVDFKNNIINDDVCKTITRPASSRKCYNYCGIWRHSAWTICSSNCGKGTQRRQVKCFDRKYRLANEDICDPLLRPTNIRQCSNYLCTPARKPKPKTSGRWKTGRWSECSKSCGRGYKRRSVSCYDGTSGLKYSDDKCDKQKRPETVLRCNLGTCPYWKVGTWSECSRTCGQGHKRRRVDCVSGISKANRAEKFTCDKRNKPAFISKCSFKECPGWRTTQWSKCSKTCGLGAVSRQVYCSNSTHVLSDRKCNKKLRPSQMKSCYSKSCLPSVRWVKGKWNPCSVQCGTGIKKRSVWCEDIHGKQVHYARCRHLRRRPRSEKKCRRNTCGIWETGLWGQCSKKCGPGVIERSVRCLRDSSFVTDNVCSNRKKPTHQKSCNLRKCEAQNSRYKWFATSFSPCSTTCGAGVQSRMVICTDQNDRQVPSENCDSENKPAKIALCDNKPCTPEWSVGHWSECSKGCDEGTQSRTVTCPEKDRNSNDLCDKTKKPPHERRCNRGSCNSFYTWKTGPWSECSATCGEATMRRAVKCLGRNNQYSSEKRCMQRGVIKPDHTRKCSLPKCEHRSCKDIQNQLGKQADAEFNITVNHKKIQVYCHGMLTNKPKEYITLRSGPQHNFAEYYHRSLRNPNTCPYNGGRNEDCPLCHRDLFPTSGGTYFSKVRFDVSRMSIIGGDFTFAVTRGNHSPSYGTAGDCYSKSKCPQGRFSIDLTNTGISLSPEVTWKSYGYYLSRTITINKGRQIITGMCGGYCGVCRPYRTLRVAL